MAMRRPSCLFDGNAPFLDDLYSSYLSNKKSVSEEWQQYFLEIDEGQCETEREISLRHSEAQIRMLEIGTQAASSQQRTSEESLHIDGTKQVAVLHSVRRTNKNNKVNLQHQKENRPKLAKKIPGRN